MQIKRTNILINKSFQLKFSALLLIPILIIQTLLWLAIEIFFRNMIARGEAHHLPAGHNYYHLLAVQKNELNTILIALCLIVAVFMFIWGIYISHRIAGPFHKMESYLNNAGNLDEVKTKKLEFRENDFFLNIPKAFNQFINRL
jgi:methyl-accepting chemotaxis protein